jgi:hypothetical protein
MYQFSELTLSDQHLRSVSYISVTFQTSTHLLTHQADKLCEDGVNIHHHHHFTAEGNKAG